MRESATLNRRARQKQQTASSLTSVSRRFTADRGLAGFTIEEVCDEVDVSRRTFFNYFASKEDAVLGANPGYETQRFADDFLGRGQSEWCRVIDDLVELVVLHFEAPDSEAAGHTVFMRALEREPRLLLRYVGISRERDKHAVELVAERQGVDAADPRAEAVVRMLSALMRSASEHLIDPDDTRDFAVLMTESLALYRELLEAPEGQLARS